MKLYRMKYPFDLSVPACPQCFFLPGTVETFLVKPFEVLSPYYHYFRNKSYIYIEVFLFIVVRIYIYETLLLKNRGHRGQDCVSLNRQGFYCPQ
jgi:hypothetical protein